MQNRPFIGTSHLTNENSNVKHINGQEKKIYHNSKIINKVINYNNNNNNKSNENNESTLDSGNSSNSTTSSIDLQNINKYASTIPEIDYSDLVIATENWKNEYKLGHGGFGTVYKGNWKMTHVAIKRLEYRGNGSEKRNKIQWQQSMNELKYLNSARHDNILPLYGYSINGSEPCLIYQLMPGGSLEQRLSRTKIQTPLSWNQRLNIAVGTARGLQFLHTFRTKPLIHGDIKPANILLDPCSQPKIGDFGLAREGPNALNSSVEVSRVYGTRPYLPVEFLGYKSLSTKVDTFSFGVVLYELATGFKAYDNEKQYKYLTKYMSVLLQNNITIGLFNFFLFNFYILNELNYIFFFEVRSFNGSNMYKRLIWTKSCTRFNCIGT